MHVSLVKSRQWLKLCVNIQWVIPEYFLILALSRLIILKNLLRIIWHLKKGVFLLLNKKCLKLRINMHEIEFELYGKCSKYHDASNIQICESSYDSVHTHLLQKKRNISYHISYNWMFFIFRNTITLLVLLNNSLKCILHVIS